MRLRILIHKFFLSISVLAIVGGQPHANDLILANVVISDNDEQTVIGQEQKPSPAVPHEGDQAPHTDPPVTTEAQPAYETESRDPVAKIIKSTPIKSEATLEYKLSNKNQPYSQNSQKPRQYEIHGYLNKQYVYLIVEKTGERDIAGYMFDSKGNRKYVYGEWFDKSIQIYGPGPTGKSLTILPSENGAQPSPNTPVEKNDPISDNNQLIIIQNSEVLNSKISNQNNELNNKNHNTGLKANTGVINIQ